MDPVTIAAAVAVLVATGALNETGAKITGAVWSGTSRLIKLVRAHFKEDPKASDALSYVLQEPADDANIAWFSKQLERHVAEDTKFATELEALVQQAASDGAEVDNRALQVVNTTVRDRAKVGKIFNIATIQGDFKA